MTIFVFLILLSKLVCCCAVLCGNFDVRDGKSIGNLLDDNWLCIGMCRLVLLVLSLVFWWIRDKRFLRKTLFVLLFCFDSKTKFLFILSIFVYNCWSVGIWRFNVEIVEFKGLDSNFVNTYLQSFKVCKYVFTKFPSWILVVVLVLVGSLLDCFDSKTKFLFILSIFVYNCWSVGI